MKWKFFDKQKSEVLLCRFISACHNNRALKRGDREGRHAFCIKPGLILSLAKIAYRLQEEKTRKTA